MNTQTNQIAEYGYSQADYELIKTKLCQGAPDNEIAFFVKVATSRKLNPFTGQICLVGRNSKKPDGSWGKTYTIQTQIAGLRTIADRTGKYAPSNLNTKYEEDAQGNLLSATVWVKKLVAGEWHQIGETAYFEEFAQRTKDGKLTSFWAKMPKLMLAKCAEALALRKAFPDELSGLYTNDEMGQADNVPAVDIRSQPTQSPRTQALGSAPKTQPAWDTPEPEPKISKEQAAKMFEIARSNGWSDDQIKEYLEFMDYAASTEILVKDYERVCEFLKTTSPQAKNMPIEAEVVEGK